MENTRIIFNIGIILIIAYLIAIVYCTLGELLNYKHPKEEAITRIFIRIAIIYFILSFSWVAGHWAEYMEAFKCIK